MRRALLAVARRGRCLLALAGCDADDVAVPGRAPKVDVDTPDAARRSRQQAGIEDCAPGRRRPVDGGLPGVTLPCLGGGPDVDLSTLRGPDGASTSGRPGAARAARRCRSSQAFYEQYGDQVPVLGIDYQDAAARRARIELAGEHRRDLPARSPTRGGDLERHDAVPAPIRGLPIIAFVDADGTVAHQESGGIDSERRARRPRRRAPRGPPVTAAPSSPTGCEPVRAGAAAITGHDLTRFMPPEDADPRRGAVLMLFGEATPRGADLLLTERAHHMRSHPGQVSFPGGSIDPGETAGRRPRCARPRRRPGSTRPASRSSASCPSCGCRRATSRSPRCSAGGASRAPVDVVDPDEVHAVYRVPIAELLDPTHRITVRHPAGWVGPGLPDRRRQATSSCGASPPASSPGCSTTSAGPRPWDDARRCATCRRLHAAGWSQPSRRPGPTPTSRSAAVNLLDWLLVGAGAGLRAVGLLAGLRHRRLRHRRAAARRARSASGWRRSRSATPTRRCWSRSARCSS